METDASYLCLAATLNQQQQPVAFFSRTLKRSEYKHHPVEKEAAAIVESLREWRPFLLGKHFTVITDQKAISYMYNTKLKSKMTKLLDGELNFHNSLLILCIGRVVKMQLLICSHE